MKKTTKIFAFILAVMLFTGIFCSVGFLAENAHHRCIGEDCPICAQIGEAVHFLSSMKMVSVLSFFMAVLCVFARRGMRAGQHWQAKDTLVTLKVELLN